MEIITIMMIKMKVFIYWIFTGAVLHYFEWQIWNVKFNLWKFILSCFIFWVLAQFSNLLLQGWFVKGWANESSDTVIIIMLTTSLYLFIPFILKPENRDKFGLYILKRFGLTKIKDKE